MGADAIAPRLSPGASGAASSKPTPWHATQSAQLDRRHRAGARSDRPTGKFFGAIFRDAATLIVQRPSAHLERASGAVDSIGGDPEAPVRSHVRRLEARRRAGHVERTDADHRRVRPAGLPERGHAYELAHGGTNFRVSNLYASKWR